jgi:hypothetical protein
MAKEQAIAGQLDAMVDVHLADVPTGRGRAVSASGAALVSKGAPDLAHSAISLSIDEFDGQVERSSG